MALCAGTQALRTDMWFHLRAGSADMEIYVPGGGMLQHIKQIHAENVRNLQFFFMWGERKRL